jgi:NAD(P)H dehydrogenase (quinone)
MILITGAAGKTGKSVLRKVAEKGGSVTAWVFRNEQIEQVEALGAKEVIVGDVRNSTILRRAMQGVDSVYHICPNVHPDEITLAMEIIDIAAEFGITQFVYHSVLHPQIEAMPHHWKKMRVEEYLFTSGLPFTILQPAIYMQNILANWGKIIETGKYTAPYATDSRISMVDLEDVALAAANVLMEVKLEGDQPQHHIGATYELVGTPAMTPCEIAAILAEQLNRPVVAEKESMAIWVNGARNSGLGDYQIDTLVKMFNYYDLYGFWGNSWVLSCLLKRPTTSFKAFLMREIQARSDVAQ